METNKINAQVVYQIINIQKKVRNVFYVIISAKLVQILVQKIVVAASFLTNYIKTAVYLLVSSFNKCKMLLSIINPKNVQSKQKLMDLIIIYKILTYLGTNLIIKPKIVYSTNFLNRNHRPAKIVFFHVTLALDLILMINASHVSKKIELRYQFMIMKEFAFVFLKNQINFLFKIKFIYLFIN